MTTCDAQAALEAYERAVAEKNELVEALEKCRREFDAGDMRGMYRRSLLGQLRNAEANVERLRDLLYD